MPSPPAVPLLALLLACHHDPGTTPTTPTTPFVSDLGPSPEGWATLDAIAARYQELRSTLDAPEARDAVVEEVVAGWPGADDAGLTDDGYTIGVLLEEGVTGGIVTYEELASGDGDGTPAPLPRSPSPNRERAAGATGCDPGASTPTSHHVRIYDAAMGSDPSSQAWVDATVEKLVSLGWKRDEIDVYGPSSVRDKMDADLLLDLRGEGLVFYTGHGGVWSGLRFGTPGDHYLQLTAGGSHEGVMDPERLEQFRAYNGTLLAGIQVYERDERDEIVGRAPAIAMSPELFREIGYVDPGTMFFATSCNSADIADELLDGGFGATMTWAGKTNVGESYEAEAALLTGLLDGQGLEEARSDLTPDQATYGTSEVRIDLADTDAYVPGWGELTVDPADLPAGTDRLELVIPRSGAPLVLDVRPDEPVSFDGVPPTAGLQAVLRAYDAQGRLLRSTTQPVGAHPGPDNALVLGDGATFGLDLTAAPTSVAADGVEASTISGVVRAFRPQDLTEPTGDPVQCVAVALDTDLGAWVDVSAGTTGGDGVFHADLVSDQAGTATIHGLLPDDGVEATRPVSVSFGTLQARTGVIFPDGNPYALPQVVNVYDRVFVIDGEGTELCYGGWHGWTVGAGGCPSCDRSWRFSFDGFTEFGGSCAPFGYVQDVAQGDILYGVAATMTWEGSTMTDVLLGLDPDLDRWVPIGHYTFRTVDVGGTLYDAYDYVTDWGAAPWL